MWIDFDGTLAVVDKAQTMANLSVVLTELTGNKVVVVDIKTDTNGMLTQVVVAVAGGNDAAKHVVSAVVSAAAMGNNDILDRVLGAGVVDDVPSGKHNNSGAAVLVVLLCAAVQCGVLWHT